MKLTRMELLQRDLEKGRPVESGLPDLIFGRHIVDAMQEVGPTRSNGMGEVPTDWNIILPFVQATGRLEGSWEIEALVSMCFRYYSGKTSGKEALSKAPYLRENV